MKKNVILNLTEKEFSKIVKQDTLVVCINYTNKEFNAIRKNNYTNTNSILINLKKYNQILFNIKFDDENVKSTINIINKIKKYATLCNIYKKNIGIENKDYNITANIQGKFNNDNLYFSIVSALEAITIKNKKEKIIHIYRQACKYLDKEVVEKNVCGFYNDKCSVKKDTNVTMGCCHHYPHKRTGVFRMEKLQVCEYQINKKCTANCLTCKMFMCDEMIKKGYKYNVFNVPLINCFFNIFQKLVLSISFFTKEEEIIKKLLWFNLWR